MFVPVACSLCGKPFQVPEGAVGQTAACPWCHGTVTALPIGSPPATAATPEVLSLDEEPVAPGAGNQVTATLTSPPPARKRFRNAILIVLVLALAVVSTIATLSVLRYKRGYQLAQEWHAFNAPDGSCGIDLLGQPVEDTTAPERGERRYSAEGWYSGIRTWIGWRNLTPAQVQEAASDKGWVRFRETVFDKERDELKSKLGEYVARDATISQSPLTVEVRLDGPQGPVVERMLVVASGPHPRVYFLGIGSKRLDPDGPIAKHFFDSFRVNE